jgi:hypothetical protein
MIKFVILAVTLALVSHGAAAGISETRAQVLDGKALEIDAFCVDVVSVRIDPELHDRVSFTLTGSDATLLDRFSAQTAGDSVLLRMASGITCGSGGSTIFSSSKENHVLDRLDVEIPADLPISVALTGRSNLTVIGTPGPARLRLAGEVRARFLTVSGLDANLAGNCDLTIERATGDVRIVSSGANDVSINEGRIRDLTINLAGAGYVAVKAQADTASLTAIGAGNIRVEKVAGAVHRQQIGASDIRIDGAP